MKYYLVLLLFLGICFYPLDAAVYYISPDGSDQNTGLLEEQPWGTFIRSYESLIAGDTLILLDGIYNESLNPTISGQKGSPITFKSKNCGKAVIQMILPGSALRVYSDAQHTMEYLTFDGLITRSNGEYPAIQINSSDNATEEQMTNNIIIKNTGAFGSANLENVVVFSIGNNARDCLFEDVWAYGFGRKALQVFGSMRITIRRAVLRYDYWDGSGYKPNDPRTTFSAYNTIESIFENIIAIDSAPTPNGRNADRASFTSSGNETPAIISGSKRNKYRGLLALNNYGNGLEINGGSGEPTEDNDFKDIVIWESKSYGINIHSNDERSSFSNITVGNCGSTGFRVNPYPSEPIIDVQITNSFSIRNNSYGFYYPSESVAEFSNNSATLNALGGDIEVSYAPMINYLVNPQQVEGHERGANMYYRYIDGVLTDIPLWPWPNEELIKQCMCNPDDLAAVGRVNSNGEGWEPKWNTTDKTLTRYIWEYLGYEIPESIYLNTSVDIEKDKKSPTDFILSQNYPNPFNPTTVIRYSVPAVGTSFMKSVELKIYDILGREVAVLVNGMQTPGKYAIEWNGANSSGLQVGSGVYFYQLKAGGVLVNTKKMILIR